jgi:hypothetical protein
LAYRHQSSIYPPGRRFPMYLDRKRPPSRQYAYQ